MKKIYIFLLLPISASLFKAQTTFTYTGKPMYNIDVKRGGVFLGSVKVELFPNIAPHHVRNFDSLVSEHFYDTTAFHRVIPGFMIQGGDPNSRHGSTSTWGNGQAGQPTVNAEFSAAKHLRGILSAARSNNINSASSQFFICVATAASLNGQYSVYGRVIGGTMNWVDTIVNAPRNNNNLPNIKHEMFITSIGSDDTIPHKPNLITPTNNTGTINIVAQQLFKWSAISDGIIYTLEVADDSLFTNIVKTMVTGNTTTYISNTFTQDTKYFWRVKVNNGGHFSDWSTIWNFGEKPDTTASTTGIATQLPDEKTRVFPNPSHGRFTITSLKKGSTVEVYDLSGRLVYQSTVKENELVIDLEGRAKGLYTYKISSAEQKTIEGKLIVE